MNAKVKGYALGSVAAATYGMNPLFALPLYEGGMDAESVLFFRYLFALPILAGMLLWRRRGFAVSHGGWLPLVAMGVMVALSSLGLFMSYRYMDVGIASTLLFVYPVMVAVIMVCLFHERLSVLTCVCIVMALVGISLLYKGEDGAVLSAVGTFWVFVSALTYAVYIVYVSRSRLNTMPTLKVTFYVLLFGWMLFAVRLLCMGQVLLPGQWWGWGCLFALALFPTAISFLCTTQAIQYIGSTPTAILGALEPVTAVIIGVMVFGETMTGRTVAGILLIICAVTLIVAGGTIGHHLVRLKRMFPKVPKKQK